MSESKKAVSITDEEFQTLLKENGVSLVEFWAEWCGPCKTLSPILDTLAEEFAGKLKVYKMDVDVNPETPQNFQVRSIPTVLLLKEGKLVDRIVGAQGKNNFVQAINKVLAG